MSTVTLPADLDTSSFKTDFLHQTQSVSSKVYPINRHDIFPYVFSALRKLDERYKSFSPIDAAPRNGGLLHILLGYRLDEAPRKNIYQSLGDPDLVNPDNMNLNKSQKEPIREGFVAPAGFVLVQGGAGTGKSHFVAQAVRPLFRHKTRAHRLLVTSAANSDRDSLATVLHVQVEDLITKGEARGA